ncbi:MAG: restriction endonuclease subunit S [Lamprobacter sp.]|uniref:restriction endonuclease subunit S n=1 Tax=Lamprobacter sp. TaxID=3100796 RepID=UPI002B26367C|nr:restriction endonuclease subunit S [Lamprobacter sp.]MEA3640659.1 restriction endonuclease subunit S [Lamprobacter sp.]
MDQELYELPDGWEWKGFLDVFSTSGFKVGKIPKKDFQTEGSLPIIDQSQSYIAGYCESDEDFSGKLPVIVYGDHTNSVKHIDFKFICGADGTKVLAPKEGVFSCYLFYAISQFRPDSQGYRRHFPILKQKHIPLPPFDEQKRIVAKLDALFTRIDTAIAHLQETLKLSKALLRVRCTALSIRMVMKMICRRDGIGKNSRTFVS